MADTLITAPATEPVTADELRDYLRDPADADSVLERFITSAREYAEETCNVALITQTRALFLDGWPGSTTGDGLGWWDGVRQGSILQDSQGYVELPRAPLQSIDHIKTYSTEGVASTFASASYYVDSSIRPGRVILTPGYLWPVPGRVGNGIEIQYVAGYEDADAVPAAFKQAILQIAAHQYENRGDDEVNFAIPKAAEALLQRNRVMPGL